ncbi:ABC transporter ATP-binding protein [Cytobacillus oceanisediminis]
MNATLRLAALTKRYDDVVAVDAVDLDVPTNSFTAVVGPSGCGKSTMLEMVAGLVRPDSGRVVVDGQDLADLPAERRPVGLVFQKPLLFPHLTVAQNVGFGLRMQRVPRQEAADRVSAMLDRVRLGRLAARRPDQLSGGQEQRVAMARALVMQPSVLLLDEPFSQLDTGLRAEMRDLVRELHDASGVTTVFVTHDRSEAVEVADRLVVMLDGRVEASGSPQDLYTNPPTLSVARFLGGGNQLAAEAGSDAVRIAGSRIGAAAPGDVSGPAVVVVRPESIRLTSLDDVGALPVLVEAVRFAGTHLVVSGRTGDDQVVVAHVPVGTRIDPGQRVGLTWAPPAATVFAGARR